MRCEEEKRAVCALICYCFSLCLDNFFGRERATAALMMQLRAGYNSVNSLIHLVCLCIRQYVIYFFFLVLASSVLFGCVYISFLLMLLFLLWFVFFFALLSKHKRENGRENAIKV